MPGGPRRAGGPRGPASPAGRPFGRAVRAASGQRETAGREGKRANGQTGDAERVRLGQATPAGRDGSCEPGGEPGGREPGQAGGRAGGGKRPGGKFSIFSLFPQKNILLKKIFGFKKIKKNGKLSRFFFWRMRAVHRGKRNLRTAKLQTTHYFSNCCYVREPGAPAALALARNRKPIENDTELRW